ncbi:hypothetical protein G9A89_005009 [Geosiphon pyriformis]|nr:hypothetical protein G9A89_005009 [Geosiphon pyriformis]
MSETNEGFPVKRNDYNEVTGPLSVRKIEANESKDHHVKVEIPTEHNPIPLYRNPTKAPGELELAKFETQSIDEQTQPYKHDGPWYKDISQRRWIIFGVLAIVIVIVIVVVPVTVAHAIKTKD